MKNMNNMKNKLSTNLTGIISSLLLLSILSSCSDPEPVKVKEGFQFETATRPDQNGQQDILSRINGALAEDAVKTGKNSALQFETKSKPPAYKDIAFLPILSAKELKDLIADQGQRHFGEDIQGLLGKVGTIDFSKNFVLIVGHPKGRNTMEDMNANQPIYTDWIYDNGVENRKRKIKLSTVRMGDILTDTASLLQTWESTAYEIAYKNSDSLLLEIDKNMYSFNLKRKK
jgi:hypothetical protein